MLPLFERWQAHGLAELGQERLELTLAGRFWNVNLQAGLFEYVQRNPLAGEQGGAGSSGNRAAVHPTLV